MELEKLFNPSSIVIVGASRETRKVGHLVARNLLQQGFAGEIYFVNPKAKTILNRITYASISEIQKPIDLAVLAIPADLSLKYLDELHSLGIKQVIIYAAGFKETGEEGKKKEELLAQKAKEYGMNILGPNCIGYINTKKKINTTFLKHLCPEGNIGFISQSGALGSVLVDYSVSHANIGLSYFISLGNKTVIDEADALEFLMEDPNTDVIGMYLEDVKDGKKFRNALRKATRKKPIVILKSGTTTEGSKAAISHTGGLMGDDETFTSVFEQSGAIRATDFMRFLNIIKVYAYKRIPQNKNVLVLSNAGGAGVLLTDQIIKNNLSLVTVSESTKKKITEGFGSKKVTVRNPIDLLGDASAFDYQMAISETFKEKEIGSVIILLTPQANTEITDTAVVVAAAQVKFDKPIFPVFMGGKSTEGVRKLFDEHRMVNFKIFDDLPGTIASIVNKRAVPTSDPMMPIIQHQEEIKKILDSSGKIVNLIHSMDIIRMVGIPVEPLRYVSSASEIPSLIKETGFPVVAKIASDTITHKTETKGVYVNLKTIDELYGAFKNLNSIENKGCYVQKMHSGYEILVGAKRDPKFGPIVIVGLGGVMAELLKEVTHFVYPFSKEYFLESIERTKVGTLLKGFRNSHSIDPVKLYEIAARISVLLHDFPTITELDINPLMLTSEGPIAVDARIIL